MTEFLSETGDTTCFCISSPLTIKALLKWLLNLILTNSPLCTAGAFLVGKCANTVQAAGLNFIKRILPQPRISLPSPAPGQGLGHLWPLEPPDPASPSRVGKATSSPPIQRHENSVGERGCIPAGNSCREKGPPSSDEEAVPQKPGSLRLSMLQPELSIIHVHSCTPAHSVRSQCRAQSQAPLPRL